MPTAITHHPSSYRDPSGFIFILNGEVYRQVNLNYKNDFDHFIDSGCYAKLSGKGLIISHERLSDRTNDNPQWYTTIKPEQIPFISYPYEWSFDMLKDAALLTLQLVKESLEFGMVLKDASPYNIQWHKGKLVFIDSLSFEKYDEAEPWIAYRQYCESFLAPLLMMYYSGHSLQSLMLAYPDGIPLPIVSSLLPRRSRFSLHTYLHIHLHAKMQQKKDTGKKIVFSKKKFLNIINSLEIQVNKLKLKERQTAWSEYYAEAGTRDDYLQKKKEIINNWLDEVNIKSLADLGANEGEFSLIASGKNITTIAGDLDPYCINRLYKKIKTAKFLNIQPLVVDLSHPSPAIGVNNEERASFFQRLQVDMVMALALVHHLAIGKNIPLSMIAGFFNRLTKKYLIIEFISREDEKIQLMLSGRKDIFTNYDPGEFKTAFSQYFKILKQTSISSSGRVLYLMIKHEG